MDTEGLPKTVPLNTEIQLKGTGMFKELHVGNTGVYYETGATNTAWYQHFNPDGNTEPAPDKDTEYVNRFACGFYHFTLWWKENKFGEIGLTKPAKVIGYTNPRMSALRAKLLGPEIYKEKVNTDSKKFISYQMDMYQLLKSEDVIERLRKISERCERMNYQIKSR